MNPNTAALLACVWLTDPTAANVFLRDVIENKITVPDADPKPMASAHLSPQGALIGANAMGLYGDPSRLPSVSVITMDSMLTPWCADWKADQLRCVYADESALGVVVRVNCIGGVDQAAYLLTDVLAERNKPVVFYCQYGQLNSSAYWTAAGSDYIMASRSTDRIGGIGIYMPFVDDAGYFEKQGYVKRDIYAPESTDKNFEFREAQKGNDKPMAAWASEIRNNFKNYVESQRGSKINLKAGDPYAGGTFNATDALAIGLIDEIGTFERAVQKCIELALNEDGVWQAPQASAKTPSSIPSAGPVVTPQATATPTTSNTTMFGFVKMEALASAKNATPDKITAEMINAINKEFKDQGITGLAVVSQGDFEAGVQASAQVTALQTQLTTAQGSVKTLTDQLTEAQNKVTAFGSQPGATPTEVKPAQETQPTAGAQPTGADVIAQLPHMQELDKNPFFN